MKFIAAVAYLVFVFALCAVLIIGTLWAEWTVAAYAVDNWLNIPAGAGNAAFRIVLFIILIAIVTRLRGWYKENRNTK